MKGKRVFKQYVENHGVKMLTYHVDNGVFKAWEWVQDCNNLQQQLAFAGIRAHCANGKQNAGFSVAGNCVNHADSCKQVMAQCNHSEFVARCNSACQQLPKSIPENATQRQEKSNATISSAPINMN